MSQNVHNQMAEFAYHKISEEMTDNKEFRSLARTFPSMLQVNGLGASIAFLQSKGGGAHKFMYNLLNQWTSDKFGTTGDLLGRIVEMDSKTYRLYTNEIVNLCIWIKRFAEGLIKKDDE